MTTISGSIFRAAGTVDARAGTVTAPDGSSSKLPENVRWGIGNGGNDLLIANDKGMWLSGSGGDDTLIGGSGNDRLAGAEHLYYSGDLHPHPGGDWIRGGAGNDTIYGGFDNDTLEGGAGADFLDGIWDADILYGGGGKDTLVWSHLAVRIDGGTGVDRLRAATGGLDLREVENNVLAGIEIIDMRDDKRHSVYGVDPSDKLTLTKADVLALSSTTDILRMQGQRGDSVEIDGWFKDLGVSGEFHHYKLGRATLLVDTDVVVT